MEILTSASSPFVWSYISSRPKATLRFQTRSTLSRRLRRSSRKDNFKFLTRPGFTLQGPGGRSYSKYNIGLALYYLPVVAAGDAVVGGSPGTALFLCLRCSALRRSSRLITAIARWFWDRRFPAVRTGSASAAIRCVPSRFARTARVFVHGWEARTSSIPTVWGFATSACARFRLPLRGRAF